MNLEEERKAEMTLVMMLHKLPSRQARRRFCESLGVEWEEYQRLKQKYSKLLFIYDQKEKNKCTTTKP
jgi:hypothetical protein